MRRYEELSEEEKAVARRVVFRLQSEMFLSCDESLEEAGRMLSHASVEKICYLDSGEIGIRLSDFMGSKS